MASNLHKDLSDSQLHYPKGFATASNSTQLTKNASGNLEWATAKAGGVTQIVAGSNITISPSGGTGAVTINSTASGESCGLMKSIDMGYFATGIQFGKSLPYQATLNLANCSGIVGSSYELEIGVAYTIKGGLVDGVIGDVWCAVEGNTGQIITSSINSLGTQPRECGSCAEKTGVCYMYGFWKVLFPVLSNPITSVQITLGSGCEDYQITHSQISQASYISLKEFCSPLAPQTFSGKGGEEPKKS